MSFVVDAKWLLLVPLVPTMVFVSWVLWNLSREIWAERRTYRGSPARVIRPESPSARIHRPRYPERKENFIQSDDFAVSSARRPEPVVPLPPRHRRSPLPVPPSRARSQN
jgi:hypothetical protein